LDRPSPAAQALRTSTVFNQNLINGNFIAAANSLISGAGLTVTGAQNNASLGLVPSGRLIRNGCDRIANGQTTFNGIQLRCFPENYLIANPQLGTATYRVNSGSSYYHSMQAQFTLRPTGRSLRSEHIHLVKDDGDTRRRQYQSLEPKAGSSPLFQQCAARSAHERKPSSCRSALGNCSSGIAAALWPACWKGGRPALF
jgi:hypothetical protein